MANSGLIRDYLGYGTHAARPATPPTGSGVAPLYYETDTTTAFVWNGAAWVALSGGGGGGSALTQIASTVLGAPAASVTFAAIPGTYTSLLLHGLYRSTAAQIFCKLFAQFNGDTAAHYDWTWLLASPGSTTQSGGTADTSIYLGLGTGGTGTANYFDAVRCEIPYYAQTAAYKALTGQSTRFDTGAQYTAMHAAWFRSTAALSQIKLFPDAGNWDTGTSFALYGVT